MKNYKIAVAGTGYVGLSLGRAVRAAPSGGGSRHCAGEGRYD